MQEVTGSTPVFSTQGRLVQGRLSCSGPAHASFVAMAFTDSLKERIGGELSHWKDDPVVNKDALSVGGGSINDAWPIDTDQGPFFLKTNCPDRFPSMFEAEADGSERLLSAGTIGVPRVIAFGEEQDTSFLLLEWIEAA